MGLGRPARSESRPARLAFAKHADPDGDHSLNSAMTMPKIFLLDVEGLGHGLVNFGHLQSWARYLRHRVFIAPRIELHWDGIFSIHPSLPR